MPKVHVLQAPSAPLQGRSVRCSTRSVIFTFGYVVNLVVMPFKAYLSEPLPWNLHPHSLDLAPNASFEIFSIKAFQFLSETYNNKTVPESATISRDMAANTYCLRYTMAFPSFGDHQCIEYMLGFPAALYYSLATTEFLCDFVADNTTTRLNRPLYHCQQDRFVTMSIAFSCTWIVPLEQPDTFDVYHGVQLLETPMFSWIKLGYRVGLSVFIGFAQWRLYFQHLKPLLHNLRTIGLANLNDEANYVIQLGDPTWLILSHRIVTLVMVLDCFVNVGYSGAAGNRTSQVNNIWEFCLGCLYGSRAVWAAYFVMYYATPLVKYMAWEKHFQPVDPGPMAMTAIFYAGPVIYNNSHTPSLLFFQWLHAIAAPNIEIVECALGMVVFLSTMAAVPVLFSCTAQCTRRAFKKRHIAPTRRPLYASMRFNDWKQWILFYQRRLWTPQDQVGGTLYYLFDENPRYRKYPLFSARVSDCFVTCYNTDGVVVRQVRLSLMHSLDCQSTDPTLRILLCPHVHSTSAVGSINSEGCDNSEKDKSSKYIHLGASGCQWIQ
ncbi:Aste57867_19745 [Aphanomyces stellatus]|uniref:Aste57867_19745 protein n=1 Tax=Aphanomyces stellatus TaxID=120398 RepID=A0A485LDT9_9STRA|nr:hypothetical protein As57867_019680 [Aphanomyces stellatus]VFT96443.1 Aste57867_19745 [Aphanomyces stellatus]